MIGMPERNVKKSHHRVANILINKSAVADQGAGRLAQERIDDLMRFFRSELVSQLCERRKVGEKNRHLDDPPFLDMSAAPVTKIGITRASPYSDSSKHHAQRSRQRRAADTALRGETSGRSHIHEADANRQRARVSMKLARVEDAILAPSTPQSPFVQLRNQNFFRAVDLSKPFVRGTALKIFFVVLRSRFRLVSLP